MGLYTLSQQHVFVLAETDALAGVDVLKFVIQATSENHLSAGGQRQQSFAGNYLDGPGPRVVQIVHSDIVSCLHDEYRGATRYMHVALLRANDDFVFWSEQHI